MTICAMTICDRCGWLIPTDCTCRRQRDELSVAGLRRVVAERHREAVARAYASGWAVPADDGERRAAG